MITRELLADRDWLPGEHLNESECLKALLFLFLDNYRLVAQQVT